MGEDWAATAGIVVLADPTRSMVWPTSPDAMACAGVCRVPWALRRVGCRTLDRPAASAAVAQDNAIVVGLSPA
jgi:hypothetical protein